MRSPEDFRKMVPVMKTAITRVCLSCTFENWKSTVELLLKEKRLWYKQMPELRLPEVTVHV